jgi:hypothetical protein
MTTPLVLPPLEKEICGAKANIDYFDWLKCLTALPRVFVTFVNPLPYLPGSTSIVTGRDRSLIYSIKKQAVPAKKISPATSEEVIDDSKASVTGEVWRARTCMHRLRHNRDDQITPKPRIPGFSSITWN